MSRRQGVMQAREIIKERVIALEHELATTGQSQCDRSKACDRAAISELRHMDRLLMEIGEDYPRGGKHPYAVANARSGWRRPDAPLPSVEHGEEWWLAPMKASARLVDGSETP